MTISDPHVTYEQPRVTAYGLGVLAAGGAFAAIVLSVCVVLLAQAFAAAPVPSALFTVLAIAGAVAASSAVIRQQREHALQLAEVHRAVAQSRQMSIAVAQDDAGRQVIALPPPQPQAQAPARINVIRQQLEGRYRPQLAQPVPLMATTTGPDEVGHYSKLEVPLNILMRFASCATPARHEWTGNREAYGQAAAWFVAQGILQKTKSGGYSWDPEYPLSSRREWMERLESLN